MEVEERKCILKASKDYEFWPMAEEVRLSVRARYCTPLARIHVRPLDQNYIFFDL